MVGVCQQRVTDIPSSVCRARGEAEKMEGERETVEGVKLHTKGRVLKAPTIRSEDDLFSFHGGRSAGIVKFLEPLSPLLNYFEVAIGLQQSLLLACVMYGGVEKRIAVLVIPSSWFLSSFIVQSFF